MVVLDKHVPFWIAKILKRLKVEYDGSTVYDSKGSLMWIGGFRRHIDILKDSEYTAAPTWRYVIEKIINKRY